MRICSEILFKRTLGEPADNFSFIISAGRMGAERRASEGNWTVSVGRAGGERGRARARGQGGGRLTPSQSGGPRHNLFIWCPSAGRRCRGDPVLLGARSVPSSLWLSSKVETHVETPTHAVNHMCFTLDTFSTAFWALEDTLVWFCSSISVSHRILWDYDWGNIGGPGVWFF